MAISSSNRGLQPGVCTSTTRPSAPYNGMVVYETDTGKTQVWNGTAWVMLTNSTAPPGLELIKTQTIGTTVSSVSVTNAFSSLYDSYLITVNGGANNGGSAALSLQLGSATSGYKYQLIYASWNSTVAGAGSTTGAQFPYVGSGDANGLSASITVRSPNLAKWTLVAADVTRTSSWWGFAGGVKEDTTQYTDFTLLTDTGTMTGGTIRVYGYRNS